MADMFLVPYVRSVWASLREQLAGGGRMCVFGAGAHTQWLLSVTRDMRQPPIECIVDDSPTDNAICDLPVRRPSEIDPDVFDLVLISSDRWEDELAARAQLLWGDRLEVVQLYDGLPCGPYDKTDDRAEAIKHALATHLAVTPPVNRVVILSERPGPREGKLGYALRSVGWHTVLLHKRPPAFDVSGCFDESREFGHDWEAVRIAGEFAPAIYHVIASGSYRLAEAFLTNKPGPVVLDPYDVVAGMFTDEFLAQHPDFVEEIPRERRCLQLADGVCCRSREVDFLAKQFDYSTGPRVLFPDGCWNKTTRSHDPDATEKYQPSELHFACVGHLSPSRGGKANFSGHGSKLWLAEVLAGQGVHLHVYPWCDVPASDFDDAFADYRTLERTTPCFHLHKPVPADTLVETLAQWDMGIFVYNELVEPGVTSRNFTPEKFRVAASNKMFDYIDAGLPIIHTPVDGAFIAETMARHGVSIDVRNVPPANWGDYARQADGVELRERLQVARKDYDVRRNVHRLIEFYKAVTARHAEAAGTEHREYTEDADHANSRKERQPAIV